jgi:RNA polymerase sigma factor (sigma-70 family)
MTSDASEWRRLFERLRERPRDENLWKELIARLTERARRLGSVDSATDGDDLAQTVLLRLLVKDGVDPSREPGAYLDSSLKNAAHDVARRKILALRALERLARDRTLLASEPQDVAFARHLEGLDPQDRRLLEMRFLEGRGIAEIGSILAAKPSAVAVRIFRLVRKLRAETG